jgi:hypothetical protein
MARFQAMKGTMPIRSDSFLFLAPLIAEREHRKGPGGRSKHPQMLFNQLPGYNHLQPFSDEYQICSRLYSGYPHS